MFSGSQTISCFWGSSGFYIEFVNIEFLTGAAAGMPEGQLTYAAYFTHQNRGTVVIENVNFVVTVIGHSEQPFWCQLGNDLILWLLLENWFSS
jgi:hypothetical protein